MLKTTTRSNGRGSSKLQRAAQAAARQLGSSSFGLEQLESRCMLSANGLNASYYDNGDFTSLRVARVDSNVNFDWGMGSPDTSVGADTFTARWTGQVQAKYTENYTFYTQSDDGVRLWVDDKLIIDDWNKHSVSEKSGTISLVAGQKYDIKLEYFENGGNAVSKLLWSSATQAKQIIPRAQLFADQPVDSDSNGLKAEYYSDPDLGNLHLTRTDSTVNFNWGLDSAPDSTMIANEFSARWTGQVQAKYSETYRFYTNGDDGMRLWVNGQLLVDDWNNHAATEHSGTINLIAGEKYNIKLEYYESAGSAVASLGWSSDSQVKQVIPNSQLFPTMGTVVSAPAPEPEPTPAPEPIPAPAPAVEPTPVATATTTTTTTVAARRIFPSTANVINVKTRYGAKGDGITDDTNAIQRAISENINFANQPHTLYFPAGTYLVSNTLEWRIADHTLNGGYRAYLVFQGEGKDLTTIRLKDNAAGFTNAAAPKAVVYTASRDENNMMSVDGNGNEAFQNSLYDLTIDTGKGNLGAIGINYLASNKGTLRDLRIRSGDGRGVSGIEMSRQWPGPAMISNVEVIGFDYGVRMAHYDYGMTFEDLTLRNQRVAGIYDEKNILSIHNLVSINTVPAIKSPSAYSLITLIDSRLEGGSSSNVAIDNQGHIFARNVTTTGYQAALKHKGVVIAGANITEFASQHPTSLFTSPQKSLNLPIAETPTYEDNTFANWANVKDYKLSGESDYTAAIQRAIDSGKTTVYFPAGYYTINNTIYVRGNVRKFVGLDSCIKLGSAFETTGGQKVLFRVNQTTGSSVIFDRFNVSGHSNGKGAVWFEHAGSEDLVIRDFYLGSGIKYRNVAGSGDVFIEDVTCHTGPWIFGNGQSVWARQFNPESFNSTATKIVNNGAKLWILGLKVEGSGTIIETKGGGKTELLGGLMYATQAWPSGVPGFSNIESSISLTYMETAYQQDQDMETPIRETRDGVTKTLLDDYIPLKGYGTVCSLYTGYKA